MAYQSLYRRFRPRRFAEVIGQDHLVSGLQNAVRENRVAHAYLLSGPRGTGKTTSARLLAKALNCENLGADGEPCCECPSCLAIESGSSMDLFELDAASNRGIDDMKDLVRSVAIGTPGRTKVYILDEVHMLTKEASNALLKTLEEPPGHVVFVLATTDPQKVLPTIRSRTQHIELSLVGAERMQELVRDVAERAGIEVTDEVVDYVVTRGGGSARDTLSALDGVVAAGGIGASVLPLDDLVASLADSRPDAALAAVAAAVAAGADVRELAEQLTRRLRDVFLVLMGAEPRELPESALQGLRTEGAALGPAATVRALETLGGTLIVMRQAGDPRLSLETALVKLTNPTVSGDVEALTRRVEALEAALAAGAGAGAAIPGPGEVAPLPRPDPKATIPAAPAPAPATPHPDPGRPRSERPARRGLADEARAALARASGGDNRPATPASAPVAPPPPASAPPPPPPPPRAAPSPAEAAEETGSPAARTPSRPEPSGEIESPAARPPSRPEPSGEIGSPAARMPSRPEPSGEIESPGPPAGASTADAPRAEAAPGQPVHLPDPEVLARDWDQRVLSSLPRRAQVRFRGHGVTLDADGTVHVVLPNAPHRDRCAEFLSELTEAVQSVYSPVLRVSLDVGVAASSSGPAADARAGEAPDPEPEEVDLGGLTDAPPEGMSALDRVEAIFPGAEVIEGEN